MYMKFSYLVARARSCILTFTHTRASKLTLNRRCCHCRRRRRSKAEGWIILWWSCNWRIIKSNRYRFILNYKIKNTVNWNLWNEQQWQHNTNKRQIIRWYCKTGMFCLIAFVESWPISKYNTQERWRKYL